MEYLKDRTYSDRVELFEDLMSKALCDFSIDRLKVELNKLGFFKAPASVKYHGNYEGGLFDHSLSVTQSLLDLTHKLDLVWENDRSPYIVGMFHDLCKCDNYISRPDGTFDYRSNLTLTGHGDKSVIIAQNLIGKLTREEILCIRWHMGAYDDKSVWNNLGAAIEEYPNVLWTHTADMIAARIEGI